MTARSERLLAAADAVAIAGVGETDYPTDYARSRRGEPCTDGYGYAARALRAALEESGLGLVDIDGLVVGPSLAVERAGEVLGIDPDWSIQADAANALINSVAAIAAGLAECVALVYGNNQRTGGTAYGGPDAMGGDRNLAYVYFAPWGLTSQGALYALMTSRYMETTGFGATDLAQVAIAQRRFAALNPNAIMRAPLSLDGYLAARPICEPLRLLDYCLINDGGVALIVTTRERAARSPRAPVLISGVGRADMNSGATSLRPRLLDFYRPAHRRAAEQVYAMAGVGPDDVDLVQIYDSFSVHVPVALEGFGYCGEGEAPALLADGGTGPGGRLPVNTSGGHLSGSYMQGWGHQVEIVRQLRGEAGDRQVEGAGLAHYICDAAGKVASVVFRRDGA